MTSASESSRTISVNGRRHAVAAAPATPLIYVLRNELGLKGTRFGCGTGNCGACTVQIDGHAATSCDTPLWSALEGEITTIEGIGSAEHPHLLQQSFLDLQAAQCGYCINGIIMRCKALLEAHPEPSDAQILEVLDRHLCRCGTHVRILRAVRRAVGRP
jgi:aerobic-type carbon monoxide dehydrogenase small subunit (CoxS/CutS family)